MKSEPTRAKTDMLDICNQSERQLQKWKIIDYIAAPINWETTVARNCSAQNLADHWLVLAHRRLPEREKD